MKKRAVMQSTQIPKQTGNEAIANDLEEIAELLEAQGANPFRVRAFRNAAATVRDLDRAIAQLEEAEGIDGLMRLSGIGHSLAHAMQRRLQTGRFSQLERLRGENEAEQLFATVADIGPALAQRIHQRLGIETLAELQAAANDGSLAEVPGVGAKRIRAVRESLAGRFMRRRSREAQSQGQPSDQDQDQSVDVAELLDVDEEYRRLAKRGKLPRITPRRFNPTHEAWLPVLHTVRSERHYTALFSNTARAHELGTTGDWVVIYRDDQNDHGRWTVITSQYGRLRGKRIVRGREQDCENYYLANQA